MKKLFMLALGISSSLCAWGSDFLQSNSRAIMIENKTDVELELKTASENFTRPIIVKPNFVGVLILWTPARYYINATNKDFHIIGTTHYITNQKLVSISLQPDPTQGRLVLTTKEITRSAEDQD